MMCSKTDSFCKNAPDTAGGGCFLSCDWGSSSFRLRLVSIKDGNIFGEIQSGRGATVLANELPPGASGDSRGRLFAECLLNGISNLAEKTGKPMESIPVVMSGMVTSAHGWHELEYAHPPFPVDGSGVVCREMDLKGRRLIFVSGLCTTDDVMRGEESEIIGLFSLREWKPFARRCVLVLPGTHSKHVFIEDGAIVRFITHMTGELFGALSANSVLRKTVEGGNPTDPDAFKDGVQFALDNGISAGLFKVRAYGLLGRYNSDGCASYLSGLLIGEEAASLSGYCEERPIILCAAGKFLRQYEQAFGLTMFRDRVKIVPQDVVGVLSALGHLHILRKKTQVNNE